MVHESRPTDAVETEMEILWSSFDECDVDQKLQAFERLKSAATKADLPRLAEFLKSDKNDFWIRELLAEPIGELGGCEYLPELFDALELNRLEGHDNDGFLHALTEIAWAKPEACKTELNRLLSQPEFPHKEAAKWLLSFC